MGRFEISKMLGHQARGVYSHREASSPWVVDRLIRAREKFLDLLTGSYPELVLNPGEGAQNAQPTIQFTSELREALKAMTRQVVWDHGRWVGFAALRENPTYAAYRLSCWPGLRSFRPERIKTPDERLAFWINLYNALTLDAVVSLAAYKEVDRSIIRALTFFRKAGYLVGGHRVSLDDIEHGILRGNKGHPALTGPHFASNDKRLDWVIPPLEKGIYDPRVHMALNCAGRSCPPMRVYDPEYIDIQLDLAARNFVDQSVRLDPVKGSISLSTIFRWYQGDFGGPQGVVDFLRTYLPEDERLDWIETYGEDLRVKYDRYEWSLNI